MTTDKLPKPDIVFSGPCGEVRGYTVDHTKLLIQEAIEADRRLRAVPGDMVLWTLTGPDGRQWQADSALKCAAAEQRERIPAKTALERIFAAVAEDEADDPYFGVQDEVYLTRAVSVMNDVLTDIEGWEDKALAEAIKSSKVDLCAMIECIRMRADSSYVPGSKPIDGELAATPSPAPNEVAGATGEQQHG